MSKDACTQPRLPFDLFKPLGQHACRSAALLLDAVARPSIYGVHSWLILVAASAEGALLAVTADLIHDLGAQPHHVERVEDGDGVWQFIADGVGVAAERIERGVLNAGDESWRLDLQSAGVGRPGPVGGPR